MGIRAVDSGGDRPGVGPAEGRAGGEADGAGAGVVHQHGPGVPDPVGRDPAGAAATVSISAVVGGAGGDLPRARGGVLDPVDRGSVGSGAVVGLPVVARNSGRRAYRAARADRVAWDRAARPKRCRLAGNRVLRGIVAVKLVRRWSQQQIAGWLTATYPDVPELQVSLESIYRTLYVQSRGALRKELTRYLGTGRVPRHPQECGCRKGAAADRAPSTSRTSPSLRSAPGWRDCAGGQRRAAGGAADPGRPATGPEGRAHPQDLAACISFSWS